MQIQVLSRAYLTKLSTFWYVKVLIILTTYLHQFNFIGWSVVPGGYVYDRLTGYGCLETGQQPFGDHLLTKTCGRILATTTTDQKQVANLSTLGNGYRLFGDCLTTGWQPFKVSLHDSHRESMHLSICVCVCVSLRVCVYIHVCIYSSISAWVYPVDMWATPTRIYVHYIFAFR